MTDSGGTGDLRGLARSFALIFARTVRDGGQLPPPYDEGLPDVLEEPFGAFAGRQIPPAGRTAYRTGFEEGWREEAETATGPEDPEERLRLLSLLELYAIEGRDHPGAPRPPELEEAMAPGSPHADWLATHELAFRAGHEVDLSALDAFGRAEAPEGPPWPRRCPECGGGTFMTVVRREDVVILDEAGEFQEREQTSEVGPAVCTACRGPVATAREMAYLADELEEDDALFFFANEEPSEPDDEPGEADGEA